MNRVAQAKSGIRGARDLAALWGALPVAALRYPMDRLPPGIGILALNNQLRGAAWRERCASEQGTPCVERHAPCEFSGLGRCRADALYPVYEGGGAPQWRMATLFVQWRPRAGELRLLALGESACDELVWASQLLHSRFGLQNGEPVDMRCLGDLVPAYGRVWSLDFVTPWLIGKERSRDSHLRHVPTLTEDRVVAKLYEGLSARAHKLTALCLHDTLSQRLGGHLARYVTDAVLAHSVVVREMDITPITLEAAVLGRDKPYDGLALVGQLVLEIAEPALPWLGLLDACGIGENGDKGFGQVELFPLSR
jgi:hypothetical protein